MRRVAIFAHYDTENTVKPYILHHLVALREVCDEIHFASTAQLPSDELAKVAGLATSQHIFENTGYDFGMWARVISSINLLAWDELVLTNSSVFGPIVPLTGVFEKMQGKPCDFWGLTDSLEIDYHIQSFFVVLRRRLLKSGEVERFFASVLPYRHKGQVIRSYEIGLTHFLLDMHFVPAVFASVLTPELPVGACNPCVWVPAALMDLGFPYVKVELLRDNPLGVRLRPVRKRLASSGYPPALVVELAHDPPPRRFAGTRNRLILMLRRWGIIGRSLALRQEVIQMAKANVPVEPNREVSKEIA